MRQALLEKIGAAAPGPPPRDPLGASPARAAENASRSFPRQKQWTRAPLSPIEAWTPRQILLAASLLVLLRTQFAIPRAPSVKSEPLDRHIGIDPLKRSYFPWIANIVDNETRHRQSIQRAAPHRPLPESRHEPHLIFYGTSDPCHSAG